VKVFYLVHQDVRRRAIQAVQDAPDGFRVTISEPKRTLEQNAAQWPILEAFSEQLEWPVNGQPTRMTPEEWKDVLSAAFENEIRVAPGIFGGSVMLGQRTSQYQKAKFSEWLDFLDATAAQMGVET
jgi:hypothetical protein